MSKITASGTCGMASLPSHITDPLGLVILLLVPVILVVPDEVAVVVVLVVAVAQVA